MFIIIIVTILLFVLGIFIFVKTAPQFGRLPEGERLAEISKSENYKDKEFKNLVKTEMDMSFGDMVKTMREFLSGGKNRSPKDPLPVKFNENKEEEHKLYVTWYGHSAILMEMEGKRILIDPMLGDASSPVSFMTRRFPYEEPINLEDITDIDAVIISHDHYDHLDYPTIRKIKDKVAHFYMPLGVGEHLKRWGVDEGSMTELDWWESARLGDIEIVAAPSRHFSGRAFVRNKTQWASWAFLGKHKKVYFSGDGGYAPHFKEIGERLGPFDFTMIECGQYNEKWSQIHMTPEESVQAHLDVNGAVMMPIHWGAFNLALHEWTDPAERMVAEAEEKGATYTTPYIGQRFAPDHNPPVEKWWTTP